MSQRDTQSSAASTESGEVERPYGRLYRAPFIGLVAFFVALLASPIFHSVSVLAKHAGPEEYAIYIHLAIGAVGLAVFLYGVRKEGEAIGTITGFVAGSLLWVGWASASFYYHAHGAGIDPVQLSETQRRNANFIFIESSFAICVVVLLFFVFNKDTKCDAFRWIQRVTRINLGRASSGQGRNYCRITFLETIFVTWFCYGFALYLSDDRFLGRHHVATYAIVGLMALWALYLIWKLLRFERAMPALRFAIPTKAIFWIPFGEYGPNYGFYEDVWVKPLEYTGPMWAVFIVFIGTLAAVVLVHQRREAARNARRAARIAAES
ncbi:MAG: hypothetical protein NVV62_15860 [Terricaulis sp.]|nr:hypothetical protein [Terricaulis sp.]